MTMTTVTPDVLADLAPSGWLRAAINFGNPILASKDPVTQQPIGVSVDLSRELATRLGVSVEFVTYDAAGKVVDGLDRNEWDVAFVARDPIRGKGIEQTLPYVLIEGAYLVREDSAICSNETVDHVGTTVVVGKGERLRFVPDSNARERDDRACPHFCSGRRFVRVRITRCCRRGPTTIAGRCRQDFGAASSRRAFHGH
jgi:ABC-type amino acid transport substrate-binding protein